MPEEEFLISAQDLADLVVACVAIARGHARLPEDGEAEGLTLLEWVAQAAGLCQRDLQRLQAEVAGMPEPTQAEYVRLVLGGGEPEAVSDRVMVLH